MNRRTALKAGLVLAATAHTAVLAPAMAHDDRELIALGDKLAKAWQEETKLADPNRPDDGRFEEAYATSMGIVREIEKHEAYTVDGLRVKARAVAWCYGPDEIEFDYDTTDLRLAQSIIKSLLKLTA